MNDGNTLELPRLDVSVPRRLTVDSARLPSSSSMPALYQRNRRFRSSSALPQQSTGISTDVQGVLSSVSSDDLLRAIRETIPLSPLLGSSRSRVSTAVSAATSADNSSSECSVATLQRAAEAKAVLEEKHRILALLHSHAPPSKKPKNLFYNPLAALRRSKIASKGAVKRGWLVENQSLLEYHLGKATLQPEPSVAPSLPADPPVKSIHELNGLSLGTPATAPSLDQQLLGGNNSIKGVEPTGRRATSGSTITQQFLVANDPLPSSVSPSSSDAIIPMLRKKRALSDSQELYIHRNQPSKYSSLGEDPLSDTGLRTMESDDDSSLTESKGGSKKEIKLFKRLSERFQKQFETQTSEGDGVYASSSAAESFGKANSTKKRKKRSKSNLSQNHSTGLLVPKKADAGQNGFQWSDDDAGVLAARTLSPIGAPKSAAVDEIIAIKKEKMSGRDAEIRAVLDKLNHGIDEMIPRIKTMLDQHLSVKEVELKHIPCATKPIEEVLHHMDRSLESTESAMDQHFFISSGIEERVRELVTSVNDLSRQNLEDWSKQLKMIEDALDMNETEKRNKSNVTAEVYYVIVAQLLSAVGFIIWIVFQVIKFAKTLIRR